MLSSFRPSILLLLLCRLLAGRELLRRNSKTRILGLRLISWCPSIRLSIYLLPSSCYQFFPLFFSSLFAPTCTSHAPKIFLSHCLTSTLTGTQEAGIVIQGVGNIVFSIAALHLWYRTRRNSRLS